MIWIMVVCFLEVDLSKVIMTNTDPDLEIGKVYKGLRGLDGRWLENQHYRVVAKSNATEYVNYVVSIGGDRVHLERLVKKSGWSRYYYEIQTD